MSYAEVILPLALPKTYTYQVPEEFVPVIRPGQRVEVGLGPRRKYAGLVKRIFTEKPTAFKPKPIDNLLDPEPVLFSFQLQLWSWMADYYICSEGEVMAAALPAQLKLSSETLLMFNETYGDDFSALDEEEFVLAELLRTQTEVRLDEVQNVLPGSRVYPVVKKLVEKNVCYAWESLKEKFVPRTEKFVSLHPNLHDEAALEKALNQWEGRAPKQMELLLAFLHFYRQEDRVLQSELLKKAGASAAQLKGLEEKQLLVTRKEAVDRISYSKPEIQIDFTLTEAQQLALNQLTEQIQEKQVCLLHGITSSGKTQIYIKLMEQAIRSGQQVLFLLPEIALTTQIIRRLRAHFGGYISIYHSRFSHNERMEIWNRVKSGETRIVLGARSALFLPFSTLGLVIVDEEQDSSYKQQDPAPRYHARDAAIYFASLTSARVILGSATPSFESYFNAMNGKYGYVQLTERYGKLELPAMEIADLRQGGEAKKGQKPMFSTLMVEAIRQTMAAGRQVILFQNRRGYVPYMICATCGFIPHCDHCDVTLTYHKSNHRLQCHYCGTTYPRPVACPACGTVNWKEQQFGTEKIEEELQVIFPEARVARMDVDAVRGKHAHDTLIRHVEEHRIDILVGTQMVVKGLDFDHIGLVGIIDADGLLHFADFRVHEKAFQLMVQVSGRAGRKSVRGRVIVQTAHPDHPILKFVSEGDYAGLYQIEMDTRKQFFYPPYSRLIRLSFRHKDREKTLSAASFFANTLRKYFSSYVVGPAEPVISRIRNQYIYEILLKLPKDAGLSQAVRRVIRQQISIMQEERSFRPVQVQPDVDPL